MGTIVSRRRKDGSLGYTAQIRIHRQGKCIHSESETFNRRQLATEWMRRREAELDQQRARGEPLGRGSTVAELLAWYGENIKALIFPLAELPEMGRGKGVRLQNFKQGGLADVTVFNAEQGPEWADGGGRRRNWPDWKDWLGKRAGAGRQGPRGLRKFR